LNAAEALNENGDDMTICDENMYVMSGEHRTNVDGCQPVGQSQPAEFETRDHVRLQKVTPRAMVFAR
jgi:hypothetical protein